MKARLYNSPILQELLDEITPEEMEATKQQMLKQIEMEKQTAVEWLEEMLIDNKYLLKDAGHLFEQAKQMEEEKGYETKAFWFGRGVLAGREDKINELKPTRDE